MDRLELTPFLLSSWALQRIGALLEQAGFLANRENAGEYAVPVCLEALKMRRRFCDRQALSSPVGPTMRDFVDLILHLDAPEVRGQHGKTFRSQVNAQRAWEVAWALQELAEKLAEHCRSSGIWVRTWERPYALLGTPNFATRLMMHGAAVAVHQARNGEVTDAVLRTMSPWDLLTLSLHKRWAPDFATAVRECRPRQFPDGGLVRQLRSS